MDELLEVKQHYIWDETPLKGVTETYLAQNDSLVFFESGRTVDLDKFEIQLSKITEEEFIDLSKNRNRNIVYNPFEQNEPMNITPEMLGNPPVVVKEQDPIQLILDKQKKLEETPISINLNLNLPSKKVIEFLNMMFDEEEVIEKLIQFSLNQVDNALIQKSVKETIIQNYAGTN